MEKRLVNRFSELLAIKSRRESRRISQREVAEVTGLSKRTVDNYAKNDVTRYDESSVLMLCDYFGVSVGQFLTIEEVEDPEIKDALPAAV